MSRIIRMGITASILAAREADIQKPDAIIVGTAFGCLEDTYTFLSKLVQYQEDMLSPTAFIHSTHNTIAAQIALFFQCHGYNSTYVHRAQSFENTINDALLLAEENQADNILIGGIDEITDAGFTIMERFGLYKKNETVTSENLYNTGQTGSVAGEGAAFFSLSRHKTSSCYAAIAAVELVSFVSVAEVTEKAKALITLHGIDTPDLLMTGHNGDAENDAVYNYFANALDVKEKVMKYKHWCGEYATATAFATWLASELIKNKKVFNALPVSAIKNSSIKNILIYNHQGGVHHSLILLQSC